jgi:hypothetical protein
MTRKPEVLKAPELRSIQQKVQHWPRRSAEDIDQGELKVVFRILAECRKSHPGWKTAGINYETGEVTLTYPTYSEQENDRLKRRIKDVNVLMDVARLKKFFQV